MTRVLPPKTFAFGPFTFIPDRNLLLRADVDVRIGGRALDILAVLVEHEGELVTKRELMARVWPDTVVEDSNLKVNMVALRRALGDMPGGARYIATVAGRGYRFVSPVRDAASDGAAAPLPATATRHHNLPFARASIFGRADVLDATRRDLDASRLVTLVGPGGIGKTTVALAVAEQVLGSYRDGIWIVNLALLTDGRQVPHAIAMAVGSVGHTADVLADVCRHMRERVMLLVLDNCEHVGQAVTDCVTRILAEAADVRILATSREPLRLGAERIRRLDGLEAPQSSSSLRAQDALAFPAVQLFVSRATDRLESFRLRDAEAGAVAEICRRLDGLALAIEFAATRIDSFGVGGLLNQLDNRFRVLVGRRDDPQRHRTLTATLDWSYGLLATGEAAMLRAVSVFAGAFGSDGAAAVACRATAQASADLADLAEKSLLAVEVHGDGVRYRMLETTRSYALGRLCEAGEADVTRQRHAEHVCVLLGDARTQWTHLAASLWGATYGPLLDELRGALAWAQRDAVDRSLHIRLVVAGMQLLNHFSLTEECRVHATRAVEEIDATGLSGTVFEMELKAWLGGVTMYTRGLQPVALDAMRRALEIAVQLGDDDTRLRCLRMIGVYEILIGRPAAALRTLQDFAAFAAQADRSALPEVETNLAGAELFLGHLHSARQRLELRRQSDLRDIARDTQVVRFVSSRIVDVACGLSHLLWLMGLPDTAVQMAEAAMDAAHKNQHHLSVSNSLAWACMVFYWVGRNEDCDRSLALLDEQVTRHGHFIRRPTVRFYRAALACAQAGPSDAAVAELRHALEDFRSINHLARMPYHLAVLAEALVGLGHCAEAESTILTARALAASARERWCIPELLRVQAAVHRAQGEPEPAARLLVQSMRYAAHMGALSWRLRAAHDLARHRLADARATEARSLLLTACNAFTEGLATRDLVAAAATLSALEGHRRA